MLQTFTAELWESVDRSAKAVVSLWQTLIGLIVDYELLKDGNNILLVERDALRDQVADLDSELVIAKASAIEDIAALEAKDAALEAHAADEALAGETHLVNFEAKFVRDLAD
jgi:hypothetical protein